MHKAVLKLISNDKKLVEMYEVVKAFDLQRKQRNTFFQLAKTLEQGGKTFEEFFDYINKLHELERLQIIKAEKENKDFRIPKSIYCPICDSEMNLLTVNTSPGNQTGDPKDKSVWLCQKGECMETIYNSLTITEIIKQQGGT